MPFTGGFDPGPERYGAGEGSSNAPLLQRVYQSILAQLGPAYQRSVQTPGGMRAVEVRANAYARAIVFDGYGAAQRLANEFLPSRMTAAGLLPRWERILGLQVSPSDTETVRRARVGARFAQFTRGNALQAIADAVQAALGPVYVGLFVSSPSNALVWWPGQNGSAASITALSGTLQTVAGLTGVTQYWQRANLTLSGCATSANNGTLQIVSILSGTSVQVATQVGSSTDANNGAISWTLSNPGISFQSSISSVTVQVQIPAGYTLGQFYQAVALIGPILDAALPAWVTWWWALPASDTTYRFLLDDAGGNLDREMFGH